MKHLFLTSSVSSVAHDIAKKIDLTSHNSLVFITTPAEPESGGKGWMDDDRNALINAGFKVTDYTITGKTYEQLKADLSSYDFIYMSGGNTLYLLKESQKTGFIDLIKDLVYKEEKIYIGTSAGSIIAGQKCPDYLLEENETVEIENVNGYGFVNFTILPHWGSEHFKEKYLEGRLAIAYKVNQVPLLALTDSQYVHVKDTEIEIVDVNK